MLHISMSVGDYFTLGSDTVIQFDDLVGERARITINAPREIPVLRGNVLERTGGQRPDCVLEKSPRYVKQLPWNGAKKKALLEMRETLERMGDCPETRILREKLDCIFPNRSNLQSGNAGE